jgi:hypothetical protein
MCSLYEALTRGKVGNEENFIFSKPSRTATGRTEPPLISGMYSGHTIMATTHIYLVLRIRMSGALLQLPLYALGRNNSSFIIYMFLRISMIKLM